jgi:RHS repeat-associated protein
VHQGSVFWVLQDSVTKRQRATDTSGASVLTAVVDVDPWGGETGRSSSAFQPHKFTTYERDGNSGDEAMLRRYQSYWTRFAQPDPYNGSYDLTNPQSFNRYSYTQNDPVNFVDPMGLDPTSFPIYWWTNPDGSRSTDFNVSGGTIGGSIHPGGAPGGVHGAVLDTGTEGSGRLGSALQGIKQKICSVIPSGRTIGVSGGTGLLGAGIGGGEIVINYNSGQTSAFAFGGLQGGWNGIVQGSAYTGFVYGLNDSNSNYSGGFTGVNGGAGLGGFLAASSGGLTGSARGVIPNSRGVKAGGVSVGASLFGPSGGVTVTHYTKPLQLGKIPLGWSVVDFPLYIGRQVCK